MKRKIFLLFLAIIGAFVLAACGEQSDTTFKLTLPNEVSADVSDLTKIKENTEVSLTVNIPANKLIDEFTINGEQIVLTSDTYKFRIVKDTIVEVSFKDEMAGVFYYSLTLPDEVSANVGDLTAIEDATEVTLTVTVPSGKLVESFKVNNQIVTLKNNTYSFLIVENTTVEVSFKNIEAGTNYYKLTLPSEVTANVSNLNEIEENKEITLIITVPSGKEVVNFKVNEQVVTLVNNAYTFNITENVAVDVIYKDVGVPITYYSLTLPSEVTANHPDITAIAEDSDVILTVNIPHGKTIDEFIVDGQLVGTEQNNTYSFNILADTVVSVTFKDFWEEVLPGEVEALIDSLDFDLFKEGTLSVDLVIDSGFERKEISALFEIDSNYNVVAGSLTTKVYHQDQLIGVKTDYLDGSYYYEIIDLYDHNGNIISTDSEVSYRDTSFQALEMFGALFVENPFMPTGLLSVNDFIEQIVDLKKAALIAEEDVDSVIFLKTLDQVKTIIEAGNIDIFELFNEVLAVNSKSVLEVLFAAGSFKQLKLEFGTQVAVEVSYTDSLVTKDSRVDQIDLSSVAYHTYYYHLGNNEIVEIKIDDDNVDNLKNISLIEIYNLLKPYNKGKRITALYLDEDFAVEFSPADFLTDKLDIYVKWEDIVPIEDRLAGLTAGNKIWLKSISGYELYYEDENYLYYELGGYQAKIVDKTNGKLYYITFSGQDYLIYEVFEELYKPFLFDVLSEAERGDFIEVKGLHVETANNILFIGDLINIENNFTIIEENLYLANPEPFDPSIIGDYINNAVLDEISFFYPQNYGDYIDLNNILYQVIFTLFYDSGNIRYVYLSGLIEMGATYYIDNQTLHVTFNGNDYSFEGYTFYDGSRGQGLLIDEFDFYYLTELTALPNIGLGDYYKTFYYETADGAIVNDYQELIALEISDPVIKLYSQTVKMDHQELMVALKAVPTFSFSARGYDISYSVETRMFEVTNENNEKLIFAIEDDYLSFSTLDSYFKIPTHNFDFNNFYDNNWYYNFASFNQNFKGLVETLFRFDEALNNDLTAEESSLGYLYSNGLYLSIEEEGIYLPVDGFYSRVNSEYVSVTFVEFTDQTYSFEIYNNVSLPIFVGLNNASNFGSYQYVFAEYAFAGLYQVNVSLEPLFNDPFDQYNIETNANQLYAQYFKVMPAMSYLADLQNNEMFILKGDNYSYQVNKTNFIEIYEQEELTYLIDLATSKAYYFKADVLYEIYRGEKIFNLVEFLTTTADEDFSFDEQTQYWLNNHSFKGDLSLTIDVVKETLSFGDNILAVDEYEIIVGPFESLDISGFTFAEEEILTMTVQSQNGSPLSIKYLDYLGFNMVFTSQIFETLEYQEFMLKYDGSYDDGFIYFIYFGEEIILDLADYQIKIYDETIDKVIVFAETNDFSYLGDLEEFPDHLNKDLEVFRGWGLSYLSTTISLAELAELEREVVKLYPQYSVPKAEEIFPLLAENDSVLLHLNYNKYDGTNSVSIYAYYIYKDDVFIVNSTDFTKTVYFKFDDANNNLEILSKSVGYLKYDYSLFTLEANGNFFGIDNFNGILNDLFYYRDVLNDLYTAYTIETMHYFDDGNLRVSVDLYSKRLAMTANKNHHSIFITQAPHYEFETNNFAGTLLVNTDFTEEQIILSSNSYNFLVGFNFNVDGLIFDNYYLYDEVNSILYDEPLSYHYFEELTVYGRYILAN
ncbi:MAG: hypothetical protein GX149_06000 [Acholeplasmataceae bacterium]|jgi:hypothetical protein|nr:hypothetical protein [Acholeplasmataceae bacterium]